MSRKRPASGPRAPRGCLPAGFFRSMSMRIPSIGNVEAARESPASVSGAEDRAMREALRLARRGIGTTHPNPRVGAVVLRGGEIVGRGYHARAGEAHAEVRALEAAGSEARGGTLVTTL